MWVWALIWKGFSSGSAAGQLPHLEISHVVFEMLLHTHVKLVHPLPLSLQGGAVSLETRTPRENLSCVGHFNGVREKPAVFNNCFFWLKQSLQFIDCHFKKKESYKNQSCEKPGNIFTEPSGVIRSAWLESETHLHSLFGWVVLLAQMVGRVLEGPHHLLFSIQFQLHLLQTRQEETNVLLHNWQKGGERYFYIVYLYCLRFCISLYCWSVFFSDFKSCKISVVISLLVQINMKTISVDSEGSLPPLTLYSSFLALMLGLLSLQSKAISSSSLSLSQISSSVQCATKACRLSKLRRRHDECSYSNHKTKIIAMPISS